jgi:hypothetical protein
MTRRSIAAARNLSPPQGLTPQVTPGVPPSARLNFHIGRVTLHGFAYADKQRFTQALEAKLTALALAQHEHAFPATTDMKISSIDAGALHPGASPEDAAERIAIQVFARLRGQAGGPRHG